MGVSQDCAGASPKQLLVLTSKPRGRRRAGQGEVGMVDTSGPSTGPFSFVGRSRVSLADWGFKSLLCHLLAYDLEQIM